ncbi:hypothetical protein P9209_03965 [Prescottella defluvii]|nr:hypothetical protein P9209_03965 [Prescottella defluvii]
MTKDLLTALEAMRPNSGTDELWPRHLQDAERDRIMATDSESTVPRVRSRRVASVVAVAALFAAGGVGAAAATGMMPKAFTDTFYYWQDPAPGKTPVDPATAERVGSIPGPVGTVFSVLVAHGAGSQRCVTPVFESATSVAQPGPSEFIDLGNRCRQGPEDFGELGDGAGTFVVGAYGESVGARCYHMC